MRSLKGSLLVGLALMGSLLLAPSPTLAGQKENAEPSGILIAQFDGLQNLVGQAQCASVKTLGPSLNNAASMYYSKYRKAPAGFSEFVSTKNLVPNDPKTISLSQSGFTSCRVTGTTLTCNTQRSGPFTYTYGGLGNIQLTHGQCR